MRDIINTKLTGLMNRLKAPLISYDSLLTESRAPGLLRSGQWVSMLYLDIREFELTEQIYGSLYCKQVLQTLSRLARRHLPACLEPYNYLESRRWGDDMVIYFYSPQMPPPEALELSRLAEKTRETLAFQLNKSCIHLIPAPLNFHTGYSLLSPQTGSVEKVLYNGFKEAMLIAKGHLDACEIEKRQQFSKLFHKKNINIIYQPIVDLAKGEVMGYEALSRGPVDSFFHNPVNLFGYAEKTNQLYALERVVREKALAQLAEYLKASNHKIFINISPGVVNDPSFRPDEIKSVLNDMGAAPDQVVFEVTERTSIEDFHTFHHSLEYYRRYGFLVAVDDAGSGYSSLQAISELQPDFIKIDLSLIRNIDTTPNKQTLVETFLTFSERTGSRIIAEGIETSGELMCLHKLGIPLAQGFYLARPAFPPPTINQPAVKQLKEFSNTIIPRERNGKTIPVGPICQETTTFDSRTITRELVDFFTRYPQVEGTAILDKDKPVGLVMRDKLFNQLGTQFGFAIYTERPISLVMDNNPLVMEDDTPVEAVSQAAMSRADNKVYDSIIICKNHLYKGMVSVRSLLDAITGMQVEAAMFANPLTGLPGNRQIETELTNRLASEQPFSVIYIDLDHFKGFNDCYGFERGDLVIKLTSAIIKEISAGAGLPDDMVGHIGGDDFILITRPQTAENVCRGIIDNFDARVGELYDAEDRARGYINTMDRKNHPISLPTMTVSLVIIDCGPGQYRNPEELARAAAGLKKYAKSLEGSVFVKERRNPKETAE